MTQGPSGPLISGATFIGVPGFGPADTSDFGRVLADALNPTSSVFDPRDSRDVIQSSPFLQMYDKARQKAMWSAEVSGDTPVLSASSLTINDTFMFAADGHGMRADKFLQHQDYSVFGVCLVTSGQLAETGTRALYGKNPGGGNYINLTMQGSDGHLVLATQGASAVEAHNTGILLTAGLHAICVSQVGTSLEMFVDRATNPSYSVTVGSTPAAINGRWTIGCLTDPGTGSWVGGVGPMYLRDNYGLHGSTNADKCRAIAMKAASDRYGMVLTD